MLKKKLFCPSHSPTAGGVNIQYTVLYKVYCSRQAAQPCNQRAFLSFLPTNVPASASSEAYLVDLLASAPLALARGPPRPWYPTPSTSAMAARLAACVRLQSVRIGSVRILHPTVAICSPPEAQQVCPSCCPVSGRFRSGHFS